MDFTLRDGSVEEPTCPLPQANNPARSSVPSNTACCNILLSGGLQAHEDLGGHTIDRHVGKSDAELLARLAAEPVPAVSTFHTLTEANRATREALRFAERDICSWLSNSSSQLALDYRQEEGSVGRVIPRGSTSSIPGSGVRLVLYRSTSSPIGFYIRTSFPIP